MKLNSNLTGTPLTPLSIHVGWRETMNYAAAIFDDNPAYFDDERPQGMVAHPMFTAAATWPVVGNLGGHIQGDDFPHEVLFTQVHHTEHITFHRLIRPGDQLTLSGKIAAILPHRAGTRAVVRLDATDPKNRPVFTEHIGAMMRGVECEGAGKGEEDLPEALEKNREKNPAPNPNFTPTSNLNPNPAPKPGSNPKPDPNPAMWQAKIPIPQWMPHVYDGCSNIVFPIHTSKKFAHSVGLPGILLQGTAALALGITEIINREAGGHPRAVKELSARFTGMVAPGSTIVVKKTGSLFKSGVKEIHFEIINEQRRRAISKGRVVLDIFP